MASRERTAGYVLCLILLGFSVVAGQTARIVGWNVFGLSPIPDQRLERIAGVIERIDPDLLLLSEVNPDSAAERIVEHLGDGWAPAVILPQETAGVNMNLALIFRSHVEVSNPQLIAGSGLTPERRLRKALAANVRIGNFDFVIIGVHLKAGRSTSDRNDRTAQNEVIRAFMEEATSGDEKDVILLGDYNMIPPVGNKLNDYYNFVALSPTNYLRFLSSDILNGQSSHISGCDPLRGNLLDGFAISRVHTRNEYIAGSTRMWAFSSLGHTCNSFLPEVSDHRPVIARFRTTFDDD